MEILKVASGRSGQDKIETGSRAIVNGKISFQPELLNWLVLLEDSFSCSANTRLIYLHFCIMIICE